MRILLMKRLLKRALAGGLSRTMLAAVAGTTRRRLALLAACVVGQLVWVSWVWDFGSVTIHWVP